jgi:hypothetical protein
MLHSLSVNVEANLLSVQVGQILPNNNENATGIPP